MAFIEDLGLSAANGFINSIGSLVGSNYSVNKQKELLDYQMDKYYSPKAQVRNLAAAGINPAVAMGNQSPVFSSGGSLPNVSPPQFGIGTTSLNDLANYIKSTAEAKKAGVDTKSSEEDIKLKQIEQERNKFELDLQQKYGLKRAATDLALAEQNVKLAQLSGEKGQIEKATLEYTKAKEKAISEAEESKRDILKKELDNTDKRLNLENRVLKTQGDSNLASAEASRAAALNSKQQAELTRQEIRIKKVLADNSTTPQMVRKQLEVMFDKLKAEGIQANVDAEAAFREWMQIHAQNKYFEDKPHDFAADVFLTWLRGKIGIFSIP